MNFELVSSDWVAVYYLTISGGHMSEQQVSDRIMGSLSAYLAADM
jgi:hypothetical protein